MVDEKMYDMMQSRLKDYTILYNFITVTDSVLLTAILIKNDKLAKMGFKMLDGIVINLFGFCFHITSISTSS